MSYPLTQKRKRVKRKKKKLKRILVMMTGFAFFKFMMSADHVSKPGMA
jgi:hypothetical protein